MRRIRRIGWVLLAGSLASAVGACAPTAHGQTLITVADAQAQVRHYVTVISDAFTKRSTALVNSVEAGDAAQADVAYLKGEAQTTTPPPPAQQLDALDVFVPYQSSYPAQFLAYSLVESPEAQPTASLLLFTKAGASAAWKVVLSASLEANIDVPAIAKDDAGYATLLTGGEASQLPVAPSRLSSAYAVALTAHSQTGSIAGLSPFQPGPFTSGHVLNNHDLIAPPPGAFEKLTASYGAAPSGPLAAYRVADGGTLVLFNVTEHTTYSALNGGSLNQNANRTNYGAVIPPGQYASITENQFAMDAVIEAPGAASLNVVAENMNTISGSGA